MLNSKISKKDNFLSILEKYSRFAWMCSAAKFGLEQTLDMPASICKDYNRCVPPFPAGLMQTL